MKMLLVVAIVIALLVGPAFAGADEDRTQLLRERINILQAQRETDLIEIRRIEGIFIEKSYQAERAEVARKAQEAEIVKINAEIEAEEETTIE